MAKKRPDPQDQPQSFEDSFDELQKIVARLEDGNLSLSESLKNYELGIQRLRECFRALKDAEQQVRLLVKLDGNGNLITEQFEMTDSDGGMPDETGVKHRSNPQTTGDDVARLF